MAACNGGGEERDLSRLERLVFVPAAPCILMSATTWPVDCSTETPLLVDIFEVTQAEWRAWVEAGEAPIGTAASFDFWSSLAASNPATGMTLAEAEAFAEAQDMRLPTAREWIRIAVGTRRQSYPWGPSPRESVANTLDLSLDRLAPVGTFESGSTPSGIYDLLGNAAEWVSRAIQPPLRPVQDSRVAVAPWSFFTPWRDLDGHIADHAHLTNRLWKVREVDQLLASLGRQQAQQRGRATALETSLLTSARLGLASVVAVLEGQIQSLYRQGLGLVVLREIDGVLELLLRGASRARESRQRNLTINSLSRSFRWGPDFVTPSSSEPEPEIAEAASSRLPDSFTWALGGSFLTRAREIYRYDAEAAGNVAYNASQIDPGTRSNGVGLRLVTDAEGWLRNASRTLPADPGTVRRLEQVGRRWGPAAAPLLRRLVEEEGAPEALAALLRGAVTE